MFSKYYLMCLESRIWFGKYRSKKIRWLVEHDPEYLLWADKNVENFELHIEVLNYLQSDIDDKENYNKEMKHREYKKSHEYAKIRVKENINEIQKLGSIRNRSDYEQICEKYLNNT